MTSYYYSFLLVPGEKSLSFLGHPINSSDTQTIIPTIMYSKFWPKGGLPGILHHYVRFLFLHLLLSYHESR